jgi:hypothetical protein
VFRELLEALRIIKKASEIIDNPDTEVIGKVDNREVIKTKHLGDARGACTGTPRDAGLSSKDIIGVLIKANNQSRFKDNNYYNIQYKNKNDTWDAMTVAIAPGKIVIVTIIQHSRKDATYKAKPTDITSIVESIILQY